MERLETCSKLIEEPSGISGMDLVLNRDVRLMPLAVLGLEPVVPPEGKPMANGGQFFRLEDISHPSPEGAQTCHVEGEGLLARNAGRKILLNGWEVFTRKMVEQREMRRDKVALRRKVALPLFVEKGEGTFVESKRENERRCLVHAMKNPARGRVVSL